MPETSKRDPNYYRALLDQLLQSLPPFPEDRFAGRGIVLCGGGSIYFPCLWVCLRVLRGLGCTLPIELWHRGPREMTDEMKALLRPYDVVFRDAFEAARQFPVKRLDAWELKPYAILNSSFAEVLYIDSDNVAVRNPEFLFDSELYQQTGALFWPDTEDEKTLTNVAWEMLGMSFREEMEFESGQMLIDKRRCWRPLQLTLHLNEHSDYYYSAFFGDKDTFHLAWRKLGQEYSIIPQQPGSLANYFVLVHFDAEGHRLFQHRIHAKWSITDKNQRIRGFIFEEECFALLRELQDLWPGRFEESSFTPAEQAAFDEIANRTFRSRTGGEDAGGCLFEPNFVVNWGGKLYGWRIEEDKDGDAVLIITLWEKRRLCFLRKSPKGSWEGHWRFSGQPLIELWPGVDSSIQDRKHKSDTG